MEKQLREPRRLFDWAYLSFKRSFEIELAGFRAMLRSRNGTLIDIDGRSFRTFWCFYTLPEIWKRTSELDAQMSPHLWVEDKQGKLVWRKNKNGDGYRYFKNFYGTT